METALLTVELVYVMQAQTAMGCSVTHTLMTRHDVTRHIDNSKGIKQHFQT